MSLDDISTEWSQLEGQGLVRVVPVDSFRTATVLTIKLAELAGKLSHDPDLEVNSQKVVITLITHSESAVTDKDFEYAKAVDELLKQDATDDTTD